MKTQSWQSKVLVHAILVNLNYTCNNLEFYIFVIFSAFYFLRKKLHLHGCLLKVSGSESSDIEYYSQTGCSVPMRFATLQSILQ